MRIIRNSAQCRLCNDEIESKSHHDFVSCKCGAISLDGGHDYIRRIGDPKNFIDTSYTVHEGPSVKQQRAGTKYPNGEFVFDKDGNHVPPSTPLETGPACATCGCRNVQQSTCQKCLCHLR